MLHMPDATGRVDEPFSYDPLFNCPPQATCPNRPQLPVQALAAAAAKDLARSADAL